MEVTKCKEAVAKKKYPKKKIQKITSAVKKNITHVSK
jgi:hypothetical protein